MHRPGHGCQISVGPVTFHCPTDTPDEFTTCVQKDGVVTTTVRGE